MKTMYFCLTAVAVAAMMVLSFTLPANALQEPTVSKLDRQITRSVQKLLNGKPEYSKVSFGVDDAVVVLSGTVELFSQKEALESRVRGIKKVARVDNLIVLTPTLVGDEVLYGRVHDRMSLLRLQQIKFTAHEGLVVLTGSVRNHSDLSRALMAAWNTPGVREVRNELRVEE